MPPQRATTMLCEALSIPMDATRAVIVLRAGHPPLIRITRFVQRGDMRIEYVTERFRLTPINDG